MGQREKRLAIVFGIMAGAFLIWRVAYPAVERTILRVAEENEQLRIDLDDLESQLDRVQKPRRIYRELVARTGGTSAHQVRSALYAQLNKLLEDAMLHDTSVTPRTSSPDKKTGVVTVSSDIKAKGSLQAIVTFLKEYYELPYLARLSQVKIDPPGGRAAERGAPNDFTAKVEVLVLPKHPVSLLKDESRLEMPETHVKHRDDRYAMIWEREPFTEYVIPAIPEHKPREPVVTEKPERREPPPRQIGDPERDVKVIRMTLSYGVDEVMVVNARTEAWEYVGVGDKLDDGEVLLIHPLGAVTRREDGKLRVYPVGKRLADCILLDEAVGYPEIVYAYEDYVKANLSQSHAEGAGEEALAKGPGNGTAHPLNGGPDTAEAAFVGPPAPAGAENGGGNETKPPGTETASEGPESPEPRPEPGEAVENDDGSVG